jgi:hypothetical protein
MEAPLRRHNLRAIAALGTVALLAAACGRSTSGSTAAGSPSAGAPAASAATFGSLANVCQPGQPSGAPDQGVTASQLTLGVLTDQEFTHLPDLVNTAKVFTSWCNAAGGINGRQLVANVGQTDLLQVVPAMTAACGQDFALVGNSEAFDGLAAAKRVSCLLPEFPAQTVMSQNVNAALQAYPLTDGHSYAPYAGYFSWLLKQAYPDSAPHVGILYGQSPISVPIVMADEETLTGEGSTIAYNTPFPPTGVSDWTPYAEAIKSKGIKGLVFDGTFADLAKLELVLTNMNYKLDWIDANSNAYGASFIALAGKSLGFQHNYADIDGLYPLEKASANPAAKELAKLFAKYAPGQPVTLQDLQGFSAWLLFAKAAASCGNDVTRRCVYDASLKQTDWTAGGLQAPVNLAKPDSPVDCYNVEVATPAGWEPAPFKPNNGPYRCGAPVLKLTGNFPPPVSLSSVGKSLSDLK